MARWCANAPLSDGDILAIAETELTFVASPVTPFQRMVTQPIQPRDSTKPPVLLPAEIAQMRALTEATLWQAIPVQIATVVDINSGECEACFAQLIETAIHNDSEPPFTATHAVARRYRELSRLRAIEMAQEQTAANRIFLAADLADFESSEQLFSNLDELRDRIAVDCELGVTIALPKNLDPGRLFDISRDVRKFNLLLGLFNFQGSIAQIVDLASCAPDYLVLSDAMLQGLTTSSRPLGRLELVLTTCQELNIKPVLPQCDCPKTMDQCRQLGYQFSLQSTPPSETANHDHAVVRASEPRDRLSRFGLEVS